MKVNYNPKTDRYETNCKPQKDSDGAKDTLALFGTAFGLIAIFAGCGAISNHYSQQEKSNSLQRQVIGECVMQGSTYERCTKG